MLNEFRTFIARGNVIDLAIGVIIGAAFTAIVNSLVSDMINPLIGLITGGRANFVDYYIPLGGQAANLPLAEAQAAGAVLAYGNFLTAIINFVIVALILFLIVRAINRMNAKPEAALAAPPAPPEDVVLLGEIRDLLKSQSRQ